MPAPEQSLDWSLPQQPLLSSLSAIASAYGLAVELDPLLVAGRNAAPLTGTATAAQAVFAVLAGTGLTAQIDDGALRVGMATQLEPVTVLGRAQRDGYAAASTRSATRTDTPLVETPQSIQVITRELLDDRGATKLTDVLGAVSGVNAFSHYSDFTYRGFRSNDSAASVWNGIKAFGGVGFFHFGGDLANVERIEVLKGPSSMLFSSDQPGGTINVVTKRPLAVARHEVTARVGRWNTYGAAGDFTGPLNADASLRYRLNVAAESSDTFRDHQRTHTEVLAPALAWVPDASTRVDFEIESQRDRRRAAFDRGIPAPNGVLGVVPPNWTASEPSDTSRSRSDTVYTALSHAPNDTLAFTLAARVFDKHERDFETTTTDVLDADTVQRRNTIFDDENRGFNVTAYGIKRLGQGAVRHQLLFGADVGRLQRNYFYDRYGGNLPLSIRNPVYGLPADIATFRPSFSTADQRTRNAAAYMQDAVELGDRWRLLAGVRHETYRARETDQTGVTLNNDDRATLPRLGVVYLPRPETSVYINLSRSFVPQYGYVNGQGLGGPFDPEEGRQIELGTKWDGLGRVFGGDLSFTAAVYRIVKRNVVVTDPNDADRLVQTGEVVSRGVEFDLNGRVLPHWKLNANYSLNDIEITRDTTGLQGRRTENAPRHLAGLFTRYDLPGTAWGLGAGVQYVGGGREDFGRVLQLPAYTVWNLAAYWQPTRNWSVQLNVDNVTDTVYYVGSYGDYAVYPGTPREWTVTTRYRF